MDVQNLEVTMAERYGIESDKFKSTLLKTCFPPDQQNVTPEQYTVFLVVANEHELNPFTKEIYAYPDRGKIIPVVSVDGWAKLINEHPKMDGIEFDEVFDDNNNCTAITATVFRKDRNHPTKITEYMNECRRPNAGPWRSHPIRMLRHKTLIQAARVVFGFAGIYDQDEAERILETVGGTSNEGPKTQRLVEKLKVNIEPEEIIIPLADENKVEDSPTEPETTTAPADKPRQRKSKLKEPPTSTPSEDEFDEAGKKLYDKTGDGIVRNVPFPKVLLRKEGEISADLYTLMVDEMARLNQDMSKLPGVVKSWLLVDNYKQLTDEAAKCLVKALQGIESKK